MLSPQEQVEFLEGIKKTVRPKPSISDFLNWLMVIKKILTLALDWLYLYSQPCIHLW
jgi:hypothetical protein